MLKVKIGLQNYTGVACGINFEHSVAQNVPEDWTEDHIQFRRLLALFPGSTAEEVTETKKPEPEMELGLEKIESCPKCGQVDTGQQGEYPCEECGLPTVHGDASKMSEEVEGSEAEEEAEEEAPLAPGDQVLAHYKEEFRRGVVVKVLESGIVHVNLDDDDAKYRVLDDDKVSRLGDEASDPVFEDEE